MRSRKYFYITDKKDGKLPCNWRSYFRGSVWEPIPETNKYYLHSFHKKQPDLNWENPKVRQEVKLPASAKKVLLNNGKTMEAEVQSVVLDGYQVIIAEL